MFEVHCNLCSGNFILDNEPDATWSCICQNKPKNMPYSILMKCSKGHRTWVRSRSKECSECQKEKTNEVSKKLLEIQSEVPHQNTEQSIVKTNEILYTSREKFYEKFHRKQDCGIPQ